MMNVTTPEFPLTEDQRLLGQIIQSHDRTLAESAFGQLRELRGTDDAWSLANRNGVASIVGHYADAQPSEGHSPEMAAGFATSHYRMARRIQGYMNHLDRIAAALADDGIHVVALKNAGIARGIYTCPGCNPMGDLDLLVHRHEFLRAHRILMDMGHVFQFRSELERNDVAHAEVHGGSEYRFELANGETLWVELQWRPVAGRWIQPDQEPDGGTLIDRSSALDGGGVRILEPVDNLLQVALHTAKHSFVRAPGYRLHTDVDRVVSRTTIDWDRFIAMAQTYQVRTPVYFSLLLARDLLGTSIPQPVLANLAPPRWKREWIAASLRRVGLFDPDAPKFKRWRYLVFNAMMYDGFTGLARAIFPDPQWMRDHYQCRGWALPWAYLRRGWDLALRRHHT